LFSIQRINYDYWYAVPCARVYASYKRKICIQKKTRRLTTDTIRTPPTDIVYGGFLGLSTFLRISYRRRDNAIIVEWSVQAVQYILMIYNHYKSN